MALKRWKASGPSVRSGGRFHALIYEPEDARDR